MAVYGNAIDFLIAVTMIPSGGANYRDLVTCFCKGCRFLPDAPVERNREIFNDDQNAPAFSRICTNAVTPIALLLFPRVYARLGRDPVMRWRLLCAAIGDACYARETVVYSRLEAGEGPSETMPILHLQCIKVGCAELAVYCELRGRILVR